MEITCPRTHQKYLWNSSDRTPNCWQKTLDFQKGKLTSTGGGRAKDVRKKKRERHQSLGWDLHLGKGAVKAEKFPHTQEPLSSGESGELCTLRVEHNSMCSGGRAERLHHRGQCHQRSPA